MEHHIPAEPVFSADDLQKRVSELGRQITADYTGKELVLICVLKGAVFFLCDLARAIDLPLQLDFISIGVQHGHDGGNGIVRITKDLEHDISGKHVLIIEDIIRSGLTTGYIVQTLKDRGTASLSICTLLQCPREQLIAMPIVYVGFEITEARLLGYGLDENEKFRNLPYIEQLQ